MRMWQTIRASSLERHVHRVPYAALVLSGRYEEAGDSGRFEVTAGNAVFHDTFEAHRNHFPDAGAIVLNLPLRSTMSYAAGIASVADSDMVARTARSDRAAAAELLISTAKRWQPRSSDWPDELALRLIDCTSLKLSQWGEENGIAPWTISRGFRQVFGTSPEAFRARIRAQRALKRIQFAQEPLSVIAAELRFADQAHMTRSVKLLTGITPQAWRSIANGFNTKSQAGI